MTVLEAYTLDSEGLESNPYVILTKPFMVTFIESIWWRKWNF